jgi:CopA family copper-resistance protein
LLACHDGLILVSLLDAVDNGNMATVRQRSCNLSSQAHLKNCSCTGLVQHDVENIAHIQGAHDSGLWAIERSGLQNVARVFIPCPAACAPAANWTGLFAPGERVRLRIINASAMTNFNVRIPGLPMTVVAADGQNVQPVETDEFQIAIAETYDVIVTPSADQAYGFIAEAIDRSGQVRATLAPRLGMIAPIPVIRERPLLTMKDMGMGEMDMSGGGDMAGMDMSGGGMAGMDHGAMDHGAMKMRDPDVAPQVKLGPGVATLSPMPMDRTGERPTGLEKVDHRVLTYKDLKSLAPNLDTRPPSREIDLHLTANMERYMWSFDGQKFSENTEPIPFRHMERVRVNLINDTMMPHPIHLHGHFFEVVTGNPGHHPLKHTVNVLPGGKVSFDLTADGLGDWAFHCHMLLHMMSGMFRVVTVRHEEDAA